MNKDFTDDDLPPPLTDETIRNALRAYGALLFSSKNARLKPMELERAQKRANRAFLDMLSESERNDHEEKVKQAIEARLAREHEENALSRRVSSMFITMISVLACCSTFLIVCVARMFVVPSA